MCSLVVVSNQPVEIVAVNTPRRHLLVGNIQAICTEIPQDHTGAGVSKRFHVKKVWVWWKGSFAPVQKQKLFLVSLPVSETQEFNKLFSYLTHSSSPFSRNCNTNTGQSSTYYYLWSRYAAAAQLTVLVFTLIKVDWHLDPGLSWAQSPALKEAIFISRKSLQRLWLL